MELERLLKKTEKITIQSEELSLLKGENFNLFHIFNMESDENKMHSCFINALLNPRGSHGQGTVFLKLFLDTLNISDYYENIDFVNTKVEHPIGEVKINGMDSSGGRIDIYIWDSKRSISIENKIYAGDQEKQIVRYCNHQRESNTVFYLNLYGAEPEGGFSKGEYKSDIEKEIDNPDFYCISYSETILDWLVKCHNVVSDFPIIRESIKQYIITVKRLTGQLINQKMDEDIKRLIVENYKSAKLISSNIEKVKISVIDEFLTELKTKLKHELGDEWIIEKSDIKKKWSSIRVSGKDWLPKYAISMQGQPHFWNNHSILGFPCREKSEIRDKLELSVNDNDLKQIKTDYPKKNKVWLFYSTIFNFSKDDDFIKLLSAEQKSKSLEVASNKIIELAYKLNRYLVMK